MTELILRSAHQHPLKPLVEAALANELRLLQAGIRRTEANLRQFETRHQMTTAEFIQQFENDELAETLEFAEWVGENRLLARLQEKLEILQSIQFEN